MMQVILLEKMLNLGGIGDKVKVKPGFARNFLLPQHKALPATEENIAKFEKQRAELEKKSKEALTIAQARAETLQKLAIIIMVRATEEGKIFGSVNTRDVVEAIKAAGEQVDKKEVILPKGPIHELGDHEIRLQLHTDVSVPLVIKIVVEEAGK
jgi:large subunit ribosomal protein L9